MNDSPLLTQFADLYKAKGLVDCENQFVEDGIINSDSYSKQAARILFIAKEHNDLNPDVSDEVYKPSYSKWWNHHVHLQFSHRIGEWAYGVLNDFPAYDKIEYQQKHDALKSIAFINVKKTSGGAAANSDLINSYIVNSRELLHRQIDEISPTIIIGCFRYNWYVEQLFGFEMKDSTPNGFGFNTWKGIRVINFYHPSSRKNKFGLYTQLAEAVKYVAVKSFENQAS